MVYQMMLYFRVSIKENDFQFTSQSSIFLNYISVNFKKVMRKSCHEQNRRMLQAYQLYQKGQYNQSLNIYESILQKTSNTELRFNLLCTISVISTALGNYNYALEMLQFNAYDAGSLSPLVKIRYYANLCFLQIVMGYYDQSINTFTEIKHILQGLDNFSDYISFVFTLFFRVSSLEQLEKQAEIKNGSSLLQAFYMLNLAFAKEICGFKGSQNLLKAAYPIFIQKKKIQLGLICIRQLLLSPICQKDIQKYQKQLSRIISMDCMQRYELDNTQSFQCCRVIAQQLVSLSKNINLSKKQTTYSLKEDNNCLWRLILNYQNKKLLNNTSIVQEQRAAISKNISMMIKQSNNLVMSQMKKTDFYLNAQREINSLLNKLIEVTQRFYKLQTGYAFRTIHQFSIEKVNSMRKMNRNRSQNGFDSRKQGKQNIFPVALVRDRSAKSLINYNKNQSNIPPANSVKSSKDQSKLKLNKMIKYCEYGSFLSKRNFNSDGGQYRFVRVTHYILKWAKNPQKIQQSCQFYPLKDIRAISYGKCTPTLLKQSNHLLKQEYCFSLKLQKRTLDFYCKDFQQVSSWICGLSQKLKQVHTKFRGYSVGRLLWKRMFFILKQNFTEKLKKHERNFYYESAQAIILFGKNNYKLPNK